jgi:hypothetical protein
MPRLGSYERPAVKIDGSGGVLDLAVPAEQVRGLWEKPGATLVGIVTLESTTFTGHALGEDKQPTVKLRIAAFEPALDNDEAGALLEAGRAMYRRRTWDGTFDQLQVSVQDPGQVLEFAFANYPTEREFQDHQEAARRKRQEQRDAEEKARAARSHD